MSKLFYMQGTCGEVFTTSNPEWHKDGTVLPTAKGKLLHKAYCAERLAGRLKQVSTIYGNVTTVSASGMSRRIQLFIVSGDRIERITAYAANALGKSWNANGIRVDGCGMDMVYHLVETVCGACGLDINLFRVESL